MGQFLQGYLIGVIVSHLIDYYIGFRNDPLGMAIFVFGLLVLSFILDLTNKHNFP